MQSTIPQFKDYQTPDTVMTTPENNSGSSEKRKQPNRVTDVEHLPTQDTTNDTNDNPDESQPDTPKTKNQNQRSPKRNKRGGNEHINPSTTTITPGKSHKKINNTSVNRRLCTRIDDDTSLNNNLSNFQHENMTRITLKLTVPASKDPTNSTIEIINL